MDRRPSLFHFPEGLDSWQRLLPYALLLSVTFALYGPALYFDFVWDDAYYIELNYRVQGLSPVHLETIWTRIYLGHYAPVHHMFLAVLYRFSGLAPFGYHLGQLLLHAACVCLLYFVLKKIEPARVALVASLLFAVHPTNIETVAWISETKSTLAFLFFLLSFWLFIRFRQGGSWRSGISCGFFLLLSLLSKINTVVAPAVFLLYDYQQRHAFTRRRIASLAGFFLLSGMMTAIHLASFHGSDEVLGTAYYGGLGVHVMNLPLFILFYLQMMVFPYPQSAWHMFPVLSQFHWTLALGWTALLASAWLLSRSNRRIQFWALWFLAFLAPVLQLIPFGIWVAERYLYIPAIGLFALGSQAFFHFWDRQERTSERLAWVCALGTILLIFSWRTWSHLPIWQNSLTLWEATVETCPTSAYCRTNFGQALLQAGQTQRGGEQLVQAVAIRPTPRYLVYLGDALTLSARNYPEAIHAYQEAIALAKDIPPAQLGFILTDSYANMARAYILQGELEQARQALQAGMRANRNNLRLWVVETFLQWKGGNLAAARQSLEMVLLMTRHPQPARLLHSYWGDAAAVGKLLADLRSLPAETHSSGQP